MIECGPELQNLLNALEKLSTTSLDESQKQSVLHLRQGLHSLIDEDYHEADKQFFEAHLILVR